MDAQIFKQIQTCLTYFPKHKISEIQDILLMLGIHYLHYCKIQPDGNRLSITTHPNYISSLFEKDLYQQHFLHGSTMRLNDLNIYWGDMNEPSETYDLRTQMGIGNIGFTIVRKNQNHYHQIYSFATKSIKNALELLNNKINLVYHFINYFHSEYHQLITDLEAYRFKLPFINETKLHEDEQQIDTFLKMTTMKKYYIKSINEYLTQKELKILAYSIQGLSSKEIAQLICRSVRTVEDHLETLKIKFKCSNIRSLISKVAEDPMLKAELELEENITVK